MIKWHQLHPMIAPLPKGFFDDDTSHQEAKDWMDRATDYITRLEDLLGSQNVNVGFQKEVPNTLSGKPKIIFLDIDGPIINTSMFYVKGDCSLERTYLNTEALANLYRILKLSGAKLVTNSTHSPYDIEDELTLKPRTLKEDLIYWGLPADVFHDDWRTKYPNYREEFFHPRQASINEWLSRNGEHDWVAIDDVLFNDERQYLIDFDRGITYHTLDKVLNFWNIENKKLVIL